KDFITIEYSTLNENWTLKDNRISSNLNKLKQNKSLNFFTKNISQGVIPGSDKIYYFVILEQTSNYYLIMNLNNEVAEIEKDLVRKIVKGNNISKYSLPLNDYYIIYPYTFQNGKQQIIE